jgi:hypothetical protein
MQQMKIKKWKEFKNEETARRVQYGLLIMKLNENGMPLRKIAKDLETNHQQVKNLIDMAKSPRALA